MGFAGKVYGVVVDREGSLHVRFWVKMVVRPLKWVVSEELLPGMYNNYTTYIWGFKP